MRHRTLPRRIGLGLAFAALGTLWSAVPSAGATTPPQNYPPVPKAGPVDDAPCTGPTKLKPIPSADQQKVQNLLGAFAGSYYQGGGPCPNGLEQIMLGPGSERMAQRIRHTFGPRVVIFIDYQLWLGKPLRSPTCGSLPLPTPHPSLAATITLKSASIKVGGNLIGSVVIKDISPGGVGISIGEPIPMVLVRPGTRRVVGVFVGPIAGTAAGGPLQPGGTTQPIEALGGTARCDGGFGSALPPGRYDAIAEVTGPTVDEPANRHGALVFTNFVPIRIR